MNRRTLTLLTLLSLALLLPVLSFGQAISGDLSGVVKDASGAAVASADVDATNLATGFKQTTKTNAQGEYRFVNLPAGHYSLDVTAPGMKGGYRDVEIVLNKVATANISTAVVSTGTTVEVNEQAVAIDTTTPTISTTFDAKQSADLPTTSTGSGVLNLSLLDAGVASTGGLGAGSGPSVGGQRPRNNNFTVEGVDNNSLSVTGPLIQVPNDAVDSFTVLQNQYSAEFGHSSGGQFNQTIKSGTNQFHGRGYEYFQNRNLNAEDSLTAQTQAPGPYSNPRYDNNRYGGQIGGPILKNKLFFFTDWEYNNIGQSATPSTGCSPTSAGYAQLATLFPNNVNLQQFQKYVPAASASDPACPSAIQVAPGLPSTDNNFGNVAVSVPTGSIGFIGPSYQNYLNTANSVDWNISEKDQVRGRLAYTKNTGFDTAAQLPTFWTTLPTTYWLITMSEYHNFSSNVNNEFRFGFNRYNNTTPTGNQVFPGLGTFPNLQIYELNGIQLGPDGNAPQETIQNLYQFVDNVSWVKGKHNIRFGGEFRWYISPQTFTQRVRGDYQWNSTSDYLNDFSPNPNAGDFAERSAGDVVYYGNKKAVYGYINDEWRISPTVTINAGLRYEYTGEPQGTALQGLNSIASVPGLLTFQAPSPSYNNIMPRVGVAWAPDPNTSVNVGFSMSNDVIYDNLGILSLPPQVQQTCDTQGPGQGGQTSGCYWSYTHFLAAGGLPSVPAPITDPTVARSLTGAYIPNQTLPYSESYTMGVQHIFDNKYTLEVRYLGTRGIHLPVQTRLNRTSPVTATQNLPTFTTNPGQGYLDTLTTTLAGLKAIGNQVGAYADAGFSANVVSFQPYGASNYNGLQVSFKRNFTNGLQFQAAYTWSHTFDNSTADVFSTVLTPRRPQNFQCFSCDYSTSALSRAQRATLALTYDAPWFKNSNWFMKNVVGNWQASPIYTYQSPELATVQSNADANLNGDSAGDRSIINPFAGANNTSSLVTPLKNTAGATVGYLATNPNAYYIQAGPGAYATASRNTLSTPVINNWDFSLLKRVNVTERQSVEFSFEALNIFNHAQYVPGYISDVQPIGYTSGVVNNAIRVGQPTFNQWNQVFTNHPRNLVLVMKYNF